MEHMEHKPKIKPHPSRKDAYQVVLGRAVLFGQQGINAWEAQAFVFGWSACWTHLSEVAAAIREREYPRGL